MTKAEQFMNEFAVAIAAPEHFPSTIPMIHTCGECGGDGMHPDYQYGRWSYDRRAFHGHAATCKHGASFAPITGPAVARQTISPTDDRMIFGFWCPTCRAPAVADYGTEWRRWDGERYRFSEERQSSVIADLRKSLAQNGCDQTDQPIAWGLES